MIITNVTPLPCHLSYGSTAPGGRTYKSGEPGPDVPLKNCIFNAVFWRDVDHDRIQIQLSDTDKDLLSKVQALHKAKRVKVTEAVRESTPNPRKPKVKRTQHPGRPDFGKTPDPVIVEIDDVDPDQLDLGHLQRANERPSNIEAIQRHMGSRV